METCYLLTPYSHQIAGKIAQLYQEVYKIYLPLVEDMCSREASEEELSHFLDYLLDFACDEKILGLYKKMCRRYLYVYLCCIRFYIEAYREMWEDKTEDSELSLNETGIL